MNDTSPKEPMKALDVLLVEDSPLNVELAVDLLELRGHRVRVAKDGEAFRKHRDVETAPDIVLMDILLPDTDGVSLLAELRAWPRWNDVPVVAVTAQALAGDRGRLLLAGFAAVITKPINTRVFAAEIEGVAQRIGRGA